MVGSDRDWLARGVRIAALLVLAVCIVAAIAAFLPGYEIYRDASDCAGRVFDFWGHQSRQPCVREDVLDRVENAGGWGVIAALVPIVLGALVVARWPRPLIAFLWPVLLFATAIAWFVATFDLTFSAERTEELWAAAVVSASFGVVAAVLLVLLAGVPIIVGVRAYVGWRRRVHAERERLPEARVRRRS